MTETHAPDSTTGVSDSDAAASVVSASESTDADGQSSRAVASSPPASNAPPPDAVRDALRGLAAGTAPRESTGYDDVVADATRRLSNASDAATFVADDGVSRLARAVANATTAGDETTAGRGRRALDALRRLERAARGERTGSRDANHFRRGHGTTLPDAGQSDDR